MRIVETANLNKQQIADIKALLEKVHQFDQTFRDPYLNNQYNFFPEMPAFGLGYENEMLVGFTVLYADEDPSGLVDIYVNVLPKFRQKGFGRKLRDWGIDVLKRYGYRNFEYVSEMKFLTQNPDFLIKENLQIDSESEYQMYYSLAKKKDLGSAKESLEIKILEKEDILEVAKMSSVAFESNLDEVIRTLEAGITDSSTRNFVLLKDKQKIGFGKVDLSEKYYYIYNLLIDEEYRNQGFGTTFVKIIINKLLDEEVREFKIGVDKDNLPALKAYQNAGFVVETEVVYLVEGK